MKDHRVPFVEWRCIIPALLSPKPSDFLFESFLDVWPSQPPDENAIEIERIVKFQAMPRGFLASLVANLPKGDTRDATSPFWRNEVLLRPEQEGRPLVRIRVDEDLDRVAVVVSGSNFGNCHAAMSTFTALTLKITNQPTDQKEWATERVRSLHHEKADVTLLEVMIDASLPLEHRRLICPETRLPM